MFNAVSAGVGVGKNAINKEITAAAGKINTETSMSGMESSATDQIAISNKKAELAYKKIPSAYAASAASEALRTASQG